MMRLADLASIDLTDPSQQHRQLNLLETVRDDPQALQEACHQLCQEDAQSNHHMCFFLLLIIEHNLKKRSDSNVELWCGIKDALQIFAKYGASQPPFLSNKTAQVLALGFAELYPAKWPDFFQSLIQTGPQIFLRTLSQIDGEVVNRQINHSKSALDRNTRLKDDMRANDVSRLVQAWRGILERVKMNELGTDIAELCFEVIGQYVEWIDINLIVNETFMSYLFILLKRSDLTDAVCDCMCEIVQKGMPPKEKCVLVENLYNALLDAGLFSVKNEDHLESIAKLVSTLGAELVYQNEKLSKETQSDLTELGKQAMIAAETKLQLAVQLLANEDNDVSTETIQFIQQYLDRVRHSDQEIAGPTLEAIIDATVLKLRYPTGHNFESSGLDEAECDEFMNEMKQLFESICLISPMAALKIVGERVMELSDSICYLDAECTIRLLYNLGECLPTDMGPISFKAQSPSELQKLVGLFVTKSVPTHQAVVRLMLETLVRYDKYFMFDKSCLCPVLQFMIGQGLMHQSGSVRSRAAYLFSRFVREMTPALAEFSGELLTAVQKCLYEGGEEFLSESDRSFVFEAAGYLVNVSPTGAAKRHQQYAALVEPLVKRFQQDITRLPVETDPEIQAVIATRASQYVSWCGRTTKCWKGPENVVNCNAGAILAECLRVFLGALELPHEVAERSLILQSIRTFLHRMLICLSTDILVLLPDALSKFLRGIQFKDLHELFPLINQIASKFKAGASNVLSSQMLSLFEASFSMMVQNTDLDEKKIICRDFFSFLNNICNCGLTEILMAPVNVSHLPTVIEHLKNGAIGTDPVAAKSCFMVFTKLSKAWVNEFPEFGQVVQHTIIPSCFIGPSSPHVDLRDAQFQMAIVESANCMKELFNISGEGLVEYLRREYMSGTLQIQQEIIDEYLQALSSKDIKAFRSYTKVFFGRRARV